MFLKMVSLVASGAALVVVIGLVVSAPEPAAPKQPLEFSHKLHAGEYEIGCLYCHANARRSSVAGIPSVQLCMGCHKNVGQDRPGVQKLTNYWEQKRPIQWIKVNDLPDFVYFSHKRHLFAKIECRSCHGPIETMDKIKKASDLNMKRCVSCHRQRKASIDCLTCHK